MYCVHCGEELDGDGRFCGACGKPAGDGVAAGFSGPEARPEPAEGDSDGRLLPFAIVLAGFTVAVIIVFAGVIVVPQCSPIGGQPAVQESAGQEGPGEEGSGEEVAADSGSPEAADQDGSEAEARAAAEAKGKLVLSGTVRTERLADWYVQMGYSTQYMTDGDATYVNLVLDEPMDITAEQIAVSGRWTTHTVHAVGLDSVRGELGRYDGEHIVIAVSPEDLLYPSQACPYNIIIGGGFELISPSA